MAPLTAKRRKAIPSSEFGLPAARKYPVNDAGHARNAKARASEMENAGRIGPGQEAEIDAAAERQLGKGKRKATPKRSAS